MWLHIAMRLGVPPQDFWRLSVIEWRAILQAADHAALSRADLAHLMGAYPDKEREIG